MLNCNCDLTFIGNTGNNKVGVSKILPYKNLYELLIKNNDVNACNCQNFTCQLYPEKHFVKIFHRHDLRSTVTYRLELQVWFLARFSGLFARMLKVFMRRDKSQNWFLDLLALLQCGVVKTMTKSLPHQHKNPIQ